MAEVKSSRPGRRLYSRGAFTFVLLVHARMNRSRVPVVVLENVHTSEFIVEPKDEFLLQYAEIRE